MGQSPNAGCPCGVACFPAVHGFPLRASMPKSAVLRSVVENVTCVPYNASHIPTPQYQETSGGRVAGATRETRIFRPKPDTRPKGPLYLTVSSACTVRCGTWTIRPNPHRGASQHSSHACRGGYDAVDGHSSAKEKRQFAQVSQFSEPFKFMCSRLNPPFRVRVCGLNPGARCFPPSCTLLNTTP